MGNSKEEKDKILTKYDKKVAKRKEEERKAKRNKFIFKTVSLALAAIIVLSAVAAFSLNYYKVHTQFIKVDNENVSGQEFDFYYGMTKSTLFNTSLYEGMTYLDYYQSYLGYDNSKKDKGQTYQDSYSWYDYFANQTVDTIKEYRALLQLANEANYEYTTADDDYSQFVDGLKSSAESNNLSLNKYIKKVYGDNASLSAIKPYAMEVLKAQSYLAKLQEDLAATDEEIDAYIAETKANQEAQAAASASDNTAADTTTTSDDSGESQEISREDAASAVLSKKYNETIQPIMATMKVDNIKNRIKMYKDNETLGGNQADSESTDTSEESTTTEASSQAN